MLPQADTGDDAPRGVLRPAHEAQRVGQLEGLLQEEVLIHVKCLQGARTCGIVPVVARSVASWMPVPHACQRARVLTAAHLDDAREVVGLRVVLVLRLAFSDAVCDGIAGQQQAVLDAVTVLAHLQGVATQQQDDDNG